MKLILVALVSCIVGTAVAVGVGQLFTTENASAADFLGFIPAMFVAALLMCGLCYAPGLYWLKRHQKHTRHFPFIAAFILNVPVFIFFLFTLSVGKFFAGLSEVLNFVTGFIVAGSVFGQGFAWYSRGKESV